jgi:hypothetical protein
MTAGLGHTLLTLGLILLFVLLGKTTERIRRSGPRRAGTEQEDNQEPSLKAPPKNPERPV